MKRIFVANRTFFIGIALVVSGASIATAQDSTAPQMISGCYVQNSGTIYVTGLPDAPTDCRAQSSQSNPHQPLVWNVQGVAGVQGDKGDKGEAGAQGETGLKGDKGDNGLKGDKGDFGPAGIQGPRGLQGTPGLAGIQRIRVTANVDVARVICPAGKKVLGGGYIAPSNGSLLVQQSYPSADDTWTVVVKNIGNARTNFDAWAVCAAVTQ